MADIYCRSADGNDADDGSTWALADATAAAAITAAGAGGKAYLSDNHAEATGAAVTLACSTNPASPTIIMSVNDSGDPQPPTALLVGASISTGAGNFILLITGFGLFKYVKFIRPGTNSANLNIGTASTPFLLRFENVTFEMSTTSASATLAIGGNTNSVDDSGCEFEDSVVTFGSVSQSILIRAPFVWRGGSAAATGSVPTSLFVPANGVSANSLIRGVDLSAFGSGKNLVNVAAATYGSYEFVNCLLGASVSATTGTHPGPGGVTVSLVNCNVSGTTTPRNEWWGYQGNWITETTIVRTGGANDGTTALSYRMTSSAAASLYSPLVWKSGYIQNNNTGSAITLTVHVVTDNVTLTDKEAWIEVEYLGTASSTLQSAITDHAADDAFFLGAGASQTTSTETWTTTGLATPVKQQLSVSFTPQVKGQIRFRVMLGKASTTMYLCPEAALSDQGSAAQYQVAPGVYLMAPASAGGGGGASIVRIP